MKKFSYIVLLLIIAAAAQSCETELEAGIDNATDAVEGEYSVLRTIEFYDGGSQPAFQMSMAFSSPAAIDIEGPTTIRIGGAIRGDSLAPIKNGVWFAIPSQVADGNRIVGAVSQETARLESQLWNVPEIDSARLGNPLEVDGKGLDGFFASGTKTVTMFYYVVPSDYADELEKLEGMKGVTLPSSKKEKLLEFLGIGSFSEIGNAVLASKAKVIRIRDVMRMTAG